MLQDNLKTKYTMNQRCKVKLSPDKSFNVHPGACHFYIYLIIFLASEDDI